jgi:acetylornithine deacetylase/succinyl-diaminopimelate desuccinylase-like protein
MNSIHTTNNLRWSFRRLQRVAAGIAIFALIALSAAQAAGRNWAALSPEEIHDAVTEISGSAIAEFRESLMLPNDANEPKDIEGLMSWMERAFGNRGFHTERIETKGSPLLFAELPAPNARRTILIYLQADGQPVEPSSWDQDNPYHAVLKEQDEFGVWNHIPWTSIDDGRDLDWRIFARSASDSKGPISQFLAAFDVCGNIGFDQIYNIKIVIDTEEELGSPGLARTVAENRERLAADFLLIFDGPPHPSNVPTIVFGARGITTITLTTYGSKVSLHSGHYGNFAPNPVFRMAEILNSMKSPSGRVLVPGFYDGITLSNEVVEGLRRVPDNAESLRAKIGIAEPESVGGSLQEAVQYPSLNVRGLTSGWVGNEARTIIPATAIAEIDIRLVKESDPDQLLAQPKAHIRELDYLVLDRPPTDLERTTYAKIVTITDRTHYRAF